MKELPQKSQELYKFLQEEYIDNGYLYSGSWPYNSLKEKGFDKEEIQSLVDAGLIQKRDCEEYAFELTPAERAKLMHHHSLCSVWFEKTGNGLLDSIQKEAQDAVGITEGTEKGSIKVWTLKHVDDKNCPDFAEVKSPYSVGQVISVEYDLPKKTQYTGYSLHSTRFGKDDGQFMVTDIVCNMLINPPMNMIELQSLDDAFNKVHPNERTMLLFEDVIMKRQKEVTPSLADKIQNASSKASHNAKGPSEKELER